MYNSGHGVQQDYVEAFGWFRKSGRRIRPAQYSLGVLYRDGNGVAQDYVRAHMWFNLAAALAEDDATREKAIKDRDLLIATMAPAQIQLAERLASKWTRGSARTNSRYLKTFRQRRDCSHIKATLRASLLCSDA